MPTTGFFHMQLPRRLSFSKVLDALLVRDRTVSSVGSYCLRFLLALLAMGEPGALGWRKAEHKSHDYLTQGITK
jgi:hypothetical protein